MKRKVVSSITLILLVVMLLNFSIVPSSSEQATQIEVVPPPTDVPKSSPFNVDVTVTNVTDLYAWQIKLYYNSSALRWLNATYPQGHVFDGRAYVAVEPLNDTDWGGTYIWFFASLQGKNLGFNGSGVLCRISFEAKALGTFTLAFSRPLGSAGDTWLLDSNLCDISFTAVDGSVNITISHDVAVTRVAPSKSVAIQGESLIINVDAENQGDYSENFSVTTYANTSIIHTETVYLTKGSFSTITFTWNTTGMAFGNYTMWAEASIVSEEVDTVDNKLIDGRVLIRPSFHDVAIDDVRMSKNFAYAGENVSIYVDSWNIGDFPETFNVTAHADGTIIGTQSLSLDSKGLTTLAFAWNTTGSVGNYTIWAEASVVPQEEVTNNNRLIDGTILIRPSFHDVAITDVRISSNYAYAGDNVDIYADAWNVGDFAETFHVTVRADKNTTVIGDEITVGTQLVSLPRKDFATLTFTWDTIGVSSGNYTISAVASNVTGEDDLTNNLCIKGWIEIFISVPCYDINITCPSTLTVNPSIFTYDPAYQARLINIGNVSIKSTGFEGGLRVLGSRNGTIRLCVNQPDVDVYTFYLPLNGEVQIPLWLMFQPETHWETYNGNFTLQLTVCGVHRRQLKIVGISIVVCQNGAYIVNNETVTFTWNLTGGSWVYLEAETNLPPGWSYSVDPPIGTLFETPHVIKVNITAPPDAKEGDLGSVTLRAYKNATGELIWHFIYFASTDNKPPTIEKIQPPTLTFTGDLLFNATVKDASGIENVQLYYSVNDGPWSNQTMQWGSGDTFSSTSYTITIPHVPDNSVIKYYIVATDWLKNQTQSDTRALFVKYDLVIKQVKASKTVVGQDYTTQINVTVANQGSLPNTSLKIVIYANTTIIHTQTIPFLANGTSTTLTFNWTPTNKTLKGNYKITAYAVPLLDETDTVSNTYTNGTVLVTIQGDVNGDKKADGKDIALCAKYFGKPASNCPNADINGDGKIDGKDIAIAAKNFGKKWT